MQRSRLHLAVLCVALLGFLSTGRVALRAQCGGVDDFPVAPMPLDPAHVGHSEVGGNAFVLETPAVICVPTASQVAGVNQIATGVRTETPVFSSPTPTSPAGIPSIEILTGDFVEHFPLSGSVMHAAGSVCTPNTGSAIAITDTVIAVVRSGELTETPLPLGGTPVSAAVIGTCAGGGGFFSILVETTAPSIEVLTASTLESFAVPAPGVALPDSYSNGSAGGVLYYTATTVYHLTPEGVDTIDLGGTYVSRTASVGSVTVTTTGTPVTIPLPVGSIVVPFSPCTEPLDSSGPDATDSAIAMNTAACPAVDGASATWPATAVVCGSPGLGACVPPLMSAFAPKWAKVSATAYTTVSGTDRDPASGGYRREKIWKPIFPPAVGAPGRGNKVDAVALSSGGGTGRWPGPMPKRGSPPWSRRAFVSGNGCGARIASSTTRDTAPSSPRR